MCRLFLYKMLLFHNNCEDRPGGFCAAPSKMVGMCCRPDWVDSGRSSEPTPGSTWAAGDTAKHIGFWYCIRTSSASVSLSIGITDALSAWCWFDGTATSWDATNICFKWSITRLARGSFPEFDALELATKLDATCPVKGCKSAWSATCSVLVGMIGHLFQGMKGSEELVALADAFQVLNERSPKHTKKEAGKKEGCTKENKLWRRGPTKMKSWGLQ